MQDRADETAVTSQRKIVAGCLALILLTALSLAAFKNWQARLCREQVVMMEVAALEYQTDLGKGLPTSLEQLIPRYLTAVLPCPAEGANRYEISPTDAGLIQCTGQGSHDRWLLRSRSGGDA